MDALFSWWQYDFMRSALFAVLLIMPLFALLGTMVVNNGMAFFSDALGHSALTGVGIGVLLGMTRYSAVMVVFAIVFALLMNRIRHSRLSSTDTVIGVFSSCGVALGLVLLSRLRQIPEPAHRRHSEHLRARAHRPGGHPGGGGRGLAPVLQPAPRCEHQPRPRPQQGHPCGLAG